MVGLEPAVFLVGFKEIENYLIESNFILQPTHSQNTAFSKQSIDFIQNTVKPNLDTLFWGPSVIYKGEIMNNHKLVNLPEPFQRLCSKLSWESKKLHDV